MSKVQINEFKAHAVATVEDFAALPLPLGWKPQRGATPSYERIREQARLQIERRQTGELGYELLPVEQERTWFSTACSRHNGAIAGLGDHGESCTNSISG